MFEQIFSYTLNITGTITIMFEQILSYTLDIIGTIMLKTILSFALKTFKENLEDLQQYNKL